MDQRPIVSMTHPIQGNKRLGPGLLRERAGDDRSAPTPKRAPENLVPLLIGTQLETRAASNIVAFF